MPTTTLTLTGNVIDETTQQALKGLEVQIWSTEQGATEPLVTTPTDDAGQFVVQLKVASLRTAWLPL